MLYRKFVLTHINKAVKTVSHLRTLIELAQLKNEGIELRIIAADGGSTDVGLAIVHLIETSPVPITGIVVEKACSMAAIILQACHTRKIHKNAYLDYHYGSWRVSLLTYFDEELMKRNTEAGMKIQRELFQPVINRTNMSVEQIHELFTLERPVYAEEALARGLIDEII